jgi:hypothetical protein
MGWVGKEDFTEDSFKEPTKLHCFHYSKGEGVFVDPPPAVVTNPMGGDGRIGGQPQEERVKGQASVELPLQGE